MAPINTFKVAKNSAFQGFHEYEKISPPFSEIRDPAAGTDAGFILIEVQGAVHKFGSRL